MLGWIVEQIEPFHPSLFYQRSCLPRGAMAARGSNDLMKEDLCALRKTEYALKRLRISAIDDDERLGILSACWV